MGERDDRHGLREPRDEVGLPRRLVVSEDRDRDPRERTRAGCSGAGRPCRPPHRADEPLHPGR